MEAGSSEPHAQARAQRTTSPAEVNAALAQGQGWLGRMELGFDTVRGRTVPVHRSHAGPLVVQSPFYPEGPVCHLYLLHPPGGVVGGDELRVEAALAPATHVLMTTPAATKLYRSAGALARVRQSLRLDDGACLEWLPQETLAFAGARAQLRTRVHLHGTARFLGWEAVGLGRPAGGEAFDHGMLRQDLELWHDGMPLMVERNALDASSALLHEAWGLSGYRSLATLLACPAEEHLLCAARRAMADFDPGRAAATLVDGVLACRVLGHDLLAIRGLLLRLWRTLRPLLMHREAVPPRIWAT